ncbi:MAG: L-2-amino-thiazoline-4-carboxylic acid hydrolase [Candidatus Hodarchaeales archaeon]|jgi:hypothetical protein
MDTNYKEFYDEDAIIEVNISKHISEGPNRLESFIQTVKSTHPSSLDIVIDELSNRFKSSEYTPKSEILNYQVLQNHPTLLKNACGALLTPILSETMITNETLSVKINIRSLLRSRLFFSYQIALSLTSIMSRKKSISYFQEFIDQGTKKMRDPSNYLEKLDAINEEVDKFQKLFQSHNLIDFKIQEGKAGYKMLKCKWYEVMKELNDPDLSYAVCCHYDFEAAKNMNPDFVLTRENTIMEGHGYCDFCYHDTRLINKVEHPSKEFWEEIAYND